VTHPDHHGHQFDVGRREYLKDQERLSWLPPEPILLAAGISAGATVIDVGAGTGFWTLPLSKLVGPTGKVVATDIEPVMIQELHELVRVQKLKNVEVLKSEEHHIPLPGHSADAAVLGFLLHHPPEPDALLKEVHRLLRRPSRVLAVDWHKKETEGGPPPEMRLSEEDTRSLLENAGFEVESLASPNDDVYILLGRGEPE
jgi:ubiquinone/menaquinone biosynthesis C-methylase UbiE